MCQKIGFCFSCVFAVIFLSLGRTFFSFFTDVPAILGYGETIFRYMTLIVMLQISTSIYTGVLRSAGDNRMTTLISFISVTMIRPASGFIFVTVLGMGIGGAWLGIPADRVSRSILTMISFHSGKWLHIVVRSFKCVKPDFPPKSFFFSSYPVLREPWCRSFPKLSFGDHYCTI